MDYQNHAEFKKRKFQERDKQSKIHSNLLCKRLCNLNKIFQKTSTFQDSGIASEEKARKILRRNYSNKDYRYSRRNVKESILENLLFKKIITEIGKPVIEAKQLSESISHSKTMNDFSKSLRSASNLCKIIENYEENMDKVSLDTNIFTGLKALLRD